MQAVLSKALHMVSAGDGDVVDIAIGNAEPLPPIADAAVALPAPNAIVEPVVHESVTCDPRVAEQAQYRAKLGRWRKETAGILKRPLFYFVLDAGCRAEVEGQNRDIDTGRRFNSPRYTVRSPPPQKLS